MADGEQFDIRRVDGGLTVVVEGDLPPLPGPLARRVDDIWAAAVAGASLYDGDLLSVDRIEGDRIVGRWTTYRRFLAQRRDPTLRAELSVRPLAASGAVRCRDGWLFGLRGATTEQSPSEWELAPAGGVDRTSLADDGIVDLRRQLYSEFIEELGPAPFAEAVRSAVPFVVVDDVARSVVDVGLRISLDCDAGDLSAAHRAGGSDEYRELAVVPTGKALRTFLSERPVIELSRIIARELGLDRNEP